MIDYGASIKLAIETDLKTARIQAANKEDEMLHRAKRGWSYEDQMVQLEELENLISQLEGALKYHSYSAPAFTEMCAAITSLETRMPQTGP